MKALLDEMLPPAIAEQLRASGHDVVATAEKDTLRSLDDNALLDFATTEKRAIVTLNRKDYLELDRTYRAEDREHAGVILVSDRFSVTRPGAMIRALDSFLSGPPPYESFIHWLDAQAARTETADTEKPRSLRGSHRLPREGRDRSFLSLASGLRKDMA